MSITELRPEISSKRVFWIHMHKINPKSNSQWKSNLPQFHETAYLTWIKSDFDFPKTLFSTKYFTESDYIFIVAQYSVQASKILMNYSFQDQSQYWSEQHGLEHLFSNIFPLIPQKAQNVFNASLSPHKSTNFEVK